MRQEREKAVANNPNWPFPKDWVAPPEEDSVSISCSESDENQRDDESVYEVSVVQDIQVYKPAVLLDMMEQIGKINKWEKDD